MSIPRILLFFYLLALPLAATAAQEKNPFFESLEELICRGKLKPRPGEVASYGKYFDRSYDRDNGWFNRGEWKFQQILQSQDSTKEQKLKWLEEKNEEGRTPYEEAKLYGFFLSCRVVDEFKKERRVITAAEREERRKPKQSPPKDPEEVERQLRKVESFFNTKS